MLTPRCLTPAANSLDSRIAGRQVPKPRCLSPAANRHLATPSCPVTAFPRGTVVTECSGRAQLPCDSRSARNGCHGMRMEPCSGRQPRCLKKLTKIALAHFAWHFIVATTMIPQQSITKNHCLGSTRRFHLFVSFCLSFFLAFFLYLFLCLFVRLCVCFGTVIMFLAGVFVYVI